MYSIFMFAISYIREFVTFPFVYMLYFFCFLYMLNRSHSTFCVCIGWLFRGARKRKSRYTWMVFASRVRVQRKRECATCICSLVHTRVFSVRACLLCARACAWAWTSCTVVNMHCTPAVYLLFASYACTYARTLRSASAFRFFALFFFLFVRCVPCAGRRRRAVVFN